MCIIYDRGVCSSPSMGWALKWGIYQLPHRLKCNRSSHKLRTPGSQKHICKKIHVKYPFSKTENGDGFGVTYPIEVKSAIFWSQHEAAHVFSPIEELWYNEAVHHWMIRHNIYIYIYIYIYINVCVCKCRNVKKK